MSGQETLITKKRRGPKPTGIGTLVGVRLHEAELARLDRWIGDPPRCTRPEAIRRLIELGLTTGEALDGSKGTLSDD